MIAAITLWGTVLNLLILLAVFATAAAVMLYLAVHRLSHAKVQPASPDVADSQSSLPNKTRTWADANRFRFLGYYQNGGTLVAAWQHTARPTLLCQYTDGPRTAFDLVSLFAGDVWLTTSSAPDGQILPRPAGKYAQVFPGLSLDELWQRHIDMEAYLVQQGGARPGQVNLPLEDTMNQANLEMLGYVQSLPAWPLRCVWWYFVRQYQRAGLSIIDQHQLGRIRLPNEPAGPVGQPARV